MKVISIDLEMNQPSKKIIQIGYIIADVQKNKILRKRSLIVNPNEPLGIIQDGRTISDFTGITEVDIKFNGMSLQDAYKILVMDVEELNPNRTPIQWGQGDSYCLKEQLGLTWDEYIFRNRIWDIKSLYQIHRSFQNKSVANGLEKALNSLGMEFKGRPHNALDDALNTYRVFYELGQKSAKFDQIIKIIQ